MMRPDTTPEEGIFNPAADPANHLGIGAGRLPDTDAKVQQLVASHHEPAYKAFLEHPALRGQIRELMGWEKEVLLKRTLLRHNNPGSLSTGVHYDKIFLRKGGAYCLTAWIPLGGSCSPLSRSPLWNYYSWGLCFGIFLVFAVEFASVQLDCSQT